MKEAFAVVGFDSAWSVKNKGAICYAIYEHGLPPEVSLPQTASFDDAARIVGDLKERCDEVLVAIDQPIIVPYSTTGRPVDTVVKSFMGKLRSAAQSAMRSGRGQQSAMFGDSAPVWKFISDVGACEYAGKTGHAGGGIVNFEAAKPSTGRTGIHLIEVYPALALAALEPGLMEHRHNRSGKWIRWAARYNPTRRRTFSVADWQLVCNTVVGCANQFGLQALSQWATTMMGLDPPSKRDQDKIDAALCLLIALQWRHQSHGVRAIGDLAMGYIVTPTSGATRQILTAVCAQRGVRFG